MGDIRTDPSLVKQGGQTACDIASQLAAARQHWAADTDEPADALGYHEARTAYLSMQDAWFAEYTVYVEVLTELCERLRAAAASYDRADNRSARAFLTGSGVLG